MNRLTLILVTVSALLLGGAWFTARALTADPAVPALATTPASMSATAPTPPPTALVAVQPSAPPPPGPTPVAQPVTPVELGSVAPPPMPAPPVNLPPVPDAPSGDEEKKEGTGEEEEAQRAFDEAWKQLKSPELAGWRTAAKFFARCLVQTPENAGCKEGLTLAEARMKAVNSTPPPMPSGRTGRHDTNYEE